MIRFFAPDIARTCMLPESDSGHCVRVLRMKHGDELEVVDGKGNLYHCTLTDPNHRQAKVVINSVEHLSKTWDGFITLAIAPTKNNDRMEWLVEKLVEIGVDRIVPLRCRRSERKDIKEDRLERVAVAAMKQSLKATLPIIDSTTPFMEFLAQPQPAQKFIAYCDPEFERKLFSREYNSGMDTVILIGPEGDFSPEEIRSSLEAGWTPVTFGDSRLRTETAGLFAVTACHVLQQSK